MKRLWSDIKELRTWIKAAIAILLALQAAFMWYGERREARAIDGLVTPEQLTEQLSLQLADQKKALDLLEKELKREAFTVADTILREVELSIGELQVDVQFLDENVAKLLEVNQHVQSSVNRHWVESMETLEALQKQNAMLQLEKKIDQRMNLLEKLIKETESQTKDKIK